MSSESTCICGHDRPEHIAGALDCKHNGCTCHVYKHAEVVALEMHTLIGDQGTSLIRLKLGQAEINLTADAAAQVALELLNASYRARSEQALYLWAKAHNIDIKELVDNNG